MSGGPKRLNSSQNEENDDLAAELERDQQLYPPQHKIGDSQGILSP